jgi:hypothetical protein
MTQQEFDERSQALWLSPAFKLYMAAYPISFFEALERTKKRTGVEPTDPKFFTSYWQILWERLPDHHSVRRGPFFEICDLAEFNVFGGE